MSTGNQYTLPKNAFWLFAPIIVLILLRGPALRLQAAVNRAVLRFDEAQSQPLLQQAATRLDGERAWWLLGLWEARAGDDAAALAAWQHGPGSYHQLLERGRAVGIGAGEWQQALLWFEYAAELEPKTAAAWAEIGHASMALEKWPEARTAYEEAVTLAPNNANYLSAYARVLMVNNYDLVQAERLLNQAVQLDSESEAAYRTLASLAQLRGDHEEALRRWQQAAAVPGHSVDTLLHLAAAYEINRRPMEAVCVLQEALLISPSSTVIDERLAQIYSSTVNNDEARQKAHRVLESEPDNQCALIFLRILEK